MSHSIDDDSINARLATLLLVLVCIFACVIYSSGVTERVNNKRVRPIQAIEANEEAQDEPQEEELKDEADAGI